MSFTVSQSLKSHLQILSDQQSKPQGDAVYNDIKKKQRKAANSHIWKTEARQCSNICQKRLKRFIKIVADLLSVRQLIDYLTSRCGASASLSHVTPSQFCTVFVNNP